MGKAKLIILFLLLSFTSFAQHQSVEYFQKDVWFKDTVHYKNSADTANIFLYNHKIYVTGKTSAVDSILFVKQGTNTPLKTNLDGTSTSSGGSAQGWLEDVRSASASMSTNYTLSGLQTIYNVSCVDGDRVLMWGQTAPKENGIWIVHSGAWTRATDADSPSEIIGSKVSVREPGNYLPGNVYTFFKCINTASNLANYALDSVWTTGSAAKDSIYYRRAENPLTTYAATSYVDGADAGLQTQIDAKEPLRYKVYRVGLSQFSTNAPNVDYTSTNELTDAGTWARVGAGIYSFTSNDIGDGTTLYIPTVYRPLIEIGNGYFLKAAWGAPNELDVETFAPDGTHSDDLLSSIDLEFRIYTGGTTPPPNFPFTNRPRTLALNISQSGTSDPTVDAEIVNEIGQYTLSYISTGQYKITSTGNFPAGKTSEYNYHNAGADVEYTVIRTTDDYVTITCNDSGGGGANSLLNNNYIEIKVWP